ncbi:TrbG/VirB9 family P-type conjugative transfer protein [Paracoccus sp. NBH48]|uniref:TrbG/VirB9 family P-type conjugative transfer protein n=1 Tax=Paracoccus sp. NBH48 TaxID=2596918 RepID=UPI002103338D|nr:TrbG/VirB9 family P-type conjugative transfer protein [Paracoccus sp. NBH48]
MWAGDTSAFQFQSIPGDRVFAIKPTASDVETNVTVLHGSAELLFQRQRDCHPVLCCPLLLSCTGTSTSRDDAGSDSANTNYGVSASSEITPTAIWDDGAFTYFRFRENSPVPAVFKVTGGRERSVNSQSMDGRIVRVSGTSQQWALRLGNQEICIVELFPMTDESNDLRSRMAEIEGKGATAPSDKPAET